MKDKISGNLTDTLSIQATNIPDAIAIYLTNGSLTYRQLDNLVWNTTAFLFKYGIRSTDVVSLTFKSELLQIITMLAIARMGGTAFSLPVQTPPIVCKELLEKTKTKFSLTDIAEENTSDILINLNMLNKLSSPIDKSVYVESPIAPWIIVSGSGSTGKSKLLPVTHQQQIQRMQTSFKWLPLSIGDRIASLVHLDYYVSKGLYLEAFHAGLCIVLFDRRIKNPITWCKTFNINLLYATVFHIHQILQACPRSSHNLLPTLKTLLISGSSVPNPLREQINKMLTKNLFVRYGINEVGTISATDTHHVYTTKGTVGKLLPNITVEIVNSDLQILSVGKTGLIRIKSNAIISGYIDDYEANEHTFIDGWFYPSDLGKFSEDGQLIHMGRADDMMIMNGINIHPAEIEQVITTHPEVTDAVAMPIKSKIHQDIPICAVTLSKNSKLTEQTLLDYTYSYLGVRSPKKVLIVDTIPRNEQGKLIRKDMINIINHRQSKKAQNNTQIEASISRKYAQLTQPFTIKLQKDLAGVSDHLDNWLTSVLKIDIEPTRCGISKDLSQVQKHGIESTWRILLLSKTLLQSIRIPVLYTGEILKIDDSHPEHYTIDLLIANIDHIPRNVYHHALRLSSHIILHFMKRPITDENIQMLFQMMKRRFITPHAQVSGSGKSTMPILQEAYRNNIPFKHLKNGIYQLGWGSKAKRINRSSTELDSPIGSMMSHNKIITALLLQEAGLPAAEHKVARSQEEALLAAKDLGWPLVVKPSDSDRGEGVTIDVVDENILQKAFTIAKDASKSKKILIEKQVDGVCCRIFIANQKMLYAVKRLPKSVKGNGKNSVKELIEQANSLEKRLPPWKKSEIFPFDDESIEAIHLAGFNLDSIPKPYELVPLRKIESTQWGGVDEDITHVIHPDNLDLSLRAAKLFGLNVAGIDIITSDISIPWYINGAIVNEVNYSPQYGGGEISRNTIDTYLHDMIEDDGRIPITVIVGDSQAMEHAKKVQKEYLNNRIHSFITDHEISLSSAGDEVHFTFRSLFKRSRALLLDPRVEALILVVQTGEFLQTGLPVDSIDNLIVDANILYHDENSKEKLSKDRFTQLLSLLKTIVY